MTVRLLVVDDEAAIVFAMSEYFTRRGWEVDCARGLLEATAGTDQNSGFLLYTGMRNRPSWGARKGWLLC